MSEALLLLLRLNLAVAVAVVMALRRPVRRLFGAGCAYALWALPPLAMAAMTLPARVVTLARPAAAPGAAGVWTEVPLAAAAQPPPGLDLAAVLTALWLAGSLAGLAWIAW